MKIINPTYGVEHHNFHFERLRYVFTFIKNVDIWAPDIMILRSNMSDMTAVLKHRLSTQLNEQLFEEIGL